MIKRNLTVPEDYFCQVTETIQLYFVVSFRWKNDDKPGHVVDGSLNPVVLDQTLDPMINSSKKEVPVFPAATTQPTQSMKPQ